MICRQKQNYLKMMEISITLLHALQFWHSFFRNPKRQAIHASIKKNNYFFMMDVSIIRFIKYFNHFVACYLGVGYDYNDL